MTPDWEVRRYWRRSARVAYAGPEDRARRVFERLKARLREGGVELLAPTDAGHVSVLFASAPDRVRTRW